MRVTACSLPVISGFVFLAVFLSWSVPLHALDAQPATAQAATTSLWRSDAALSEAEKLIQAGQYVDALTFLDQAISRNMRNIDAHVHTALVWYHLGNQEKARSALKSALMIDRNHIGAYVIAAASPVPNTAPCNG